MAEDICFELILEIFFWILLSVLWEIGIQVLMSMGMTYSEAELCLILLAVLTILLAIAANARRRKLLGKAVVLDTDGDGYVSEEEWASAGQGEQEVDSGAEQSEGDSEGDAEWWQDKES